MTLAFPASRGWLDSHLSDTCPPASASVPPRTDVRTPRSVGPMLVIPYLKDLYLNPTFKAPSAMEADTVTGCRAQSVDMSVRL